MRLTSEYDQRFIEEKINAAKMTRRQFLGGAAAAGAMGILAGCGGSGASDGAASGDASAKKVLRFAQKNAKVGIDPHVINDQLAYSISDAITEAPCMWDEDGNELPCLLTKMPEVSDDGLTYKLEFKSDIKFHDGTTLTASDVKWSAERMMWPETKYKSAYMINQIEGAQDVFDGKTKECSGITVEDDTHVTIKLAKPYATFLRILGTCFFIIFPQKACEEAGENWGMGTNLVGTGPFKLVSNDDSTQVVLEKFEDYHGTPANIDELDIEFIDDANTKMMTYVKGDIDVCDVDPSLFEQYLNDDTVKDQLHEYDPLGTYFVNLNLNTDALKDVRVRQAINLAINRQEIVDNVLHGAGIPANGWCNPKVPGYDSSEPAIEYNPDKAKELLAEAGVSNLTLDCPVRSSESTIAQVVQGYLAEVGITLNVSTMDAAAWMEKWRQGDLDTTILSWNILFADGDMMLYTYFYSDSAKAKGSFYNNPDFDQLLLDARATTDASQQEDLYKQANKLLVQQDWATCPLYYPKRYFAAKPWVKNMKIGGLVYHFRDVDIDTAEQAKAAN